MKTTKFIGAILAGSIAITSAFAAPVAASSRTDNLAKILLGAAAIGLVVHNVKKNKRARRTNVTRQDHYRPHQPRVRHHNYKPKTCLRKKYTNHGWKTFYSQRCLAKHRHNQSDGYARTHDRHNNNGGFARTHNRNNRYNRHNTHYTNSGRYYRKTHESDK